MKTLIISTFMMVFAVQLSHSNEVSKSHSDNDGSTRIIREIR